VATALLVAGPTPSDEKINEQWWSTRAQNSTTDVSFCTIIIRLSQFTAV